MEEDSINDIVSFKSGASETPAVEQVTTGEPEKAEEVATPATERDESGRFKAKQEEAKAEPVAEQPPEVKAEAKPEGKMAALLAERSKRQQAEQEREQLKQEIERLRRGEFTPEAAPEQAVQELVDRRLAPIRQKFFQQSLASAAKQYEDFEAAAEQFSALADANPALLQQFRESDDPGEFAYLVGSNTPEYRKAQLAKVQETLSQKDARIAALEADLAAAKNAQSERDAVPASLNRQPSGSVPARESDQEDAASIVRFRSS